MRQKQAAGATCSQGNFSSKSKGMNGAPTKSNGNGKKRKRTKTKPHQETSPRICSSPNRRKRHAAVVASAAMSFSTRASGPRSPRMATNGEINSDTSDGNSDENKDPTMDVDDNNLSSDTELDSLLDEEEVITMSSSDCEDA